MTASGRSDAEGGVKRVLGNRGMLENRCSQAPCNPSSRLFIRFPQTMPIVRNLIVRSPECQIVGVLIVRFPKHQQCNVNLKKGRSDSGGSAASPMIKSIKSVEREKRIVTFPSGGSFQFIGFGSPNPLLPSRSRILSPPSLREEIFFSLSTTSSFLSGIIFPFFRIISQRSEGFGNWKIC